MSTAYFIYILNVFLWLSLFFISNIWYEIFSFVIKCLYFIFKYVIIIFVYLSLYLSFFQKKSSIYSVIICNAQFYDTYVRRKSSVLPENISTSLCNYIQIIFGCLLFWVFFKISKISSVFLSNPQFYHAYLRWKASVLSEYISTSPFNYIPIVFVCRSLFLSIFLNKISILSISWCNPQFYHTCVRWKYSVL